MRLVTTKPTYTPTDASHSQRIRQATFLLGGLVLVGQSLQGFLQLQERQRRARHFLYMPEGKPLGAVYSPNGEHILTHERKSEAIFYQGKPATKEQDTLRLWDARTGALLQTLETRGSHVQQADFTSDGRAVIVQQYGFWRYDLQARRLEPLDLQNPQSTAFTRHGDLLAVWNEQTRHFELISLQTRKVVRVLEFPALAGGQVRLYASPLFSSDGRWLCWSLQDQRLCVSDCTTGKSTVVPCTLSEFETQGRRCQLAFTRDNQSLIITGFCYPVSGGHAPGLVIYDLQSKQVVHQEKLEGEGLAFIRLPLSRHALLFSGPIGDKRLVTNFGWSTPSQKLPDSLLWVPSPDGNTVLREGEAGLLKVPYHQARTALGLI